MSVGEHINKLAELCHRAIIESRGGIFMGTSSGLGYKIVQLAARMKGLGFNLETFVNKPHAYGIILAVAHTMDDFDDDWFGAYGSFTREEWETLSAAKALAEPPREQ